MTKPHGRQEKAPQRMDWFDRPQSNAPSTAIASPHSLMQTTATTAIAHPALIDDGFDARDATTVASTVHFRQGELAIAIPPLTDFTEIGVPFDCPYCAKPQAFNGQSGWR